MHRRDSGVAVRRDVRSRETAGERGGAGGPPTVLPKNEDFGAGGARSSVAYESAWSVFRPDAAS